MATHTREKLKHGVLKFQVVFVNTAEKTALISESFEIVKEGLKMFGCAIIVNLAHKKIQKPSLELSNFYFYGLEVNKH